MIIKLKEMKMKNDFEDHVRKQLQTVSTFMSNVVKYVGSVNEELSKLDEQVKKLEELSGIKTK